MLLFICPASTAHGKRLLPVQRSKLKSKLAKLLKHTKVTGTGPLAGTYHLSKDYLQDVSADCMDRCVYQRDGDTNYYCLKAGGRMFSECVVNEESGGIPSNEKYCEITPEHTMCKYPGPSAECTRMLVYEPGLSESGKQAILYSHNSLRRKVAKGEQNGQPKAANMREMVWNNELAAIAQRWANQCTMGHDKERNKIDGTYVGQNAFISSSNRKKDLDDVMSAMNEPPVSWFDEVDVPGFDPSNIDPYQSTPGTGHYTQVVWGESEELGCGQVYFLAGGWYESLTVCNYAQGGNWIGGKMYEEGEPCSMCPSGYSCNDGLCKQD